MQPSVFFSAPGHLEIGSPGREQLFQHFLTFLGVAKSRGGVLIEGYMGVLLYFPISAWTLFVISGSAALSDLIYKTNKRALFMDAILAFGGNFPAHSYSFNGENYFWRLN